MIDVASYLRRIGSDRVHEPDGASLQALHRAHLLAVPFENLDIHLGRPIELSEQSLHRKIVDDRRGGFCYELNGRSPRCCARWGSACRCSRRES